MSILAWKELTPGSRINALIEELRWGRYEFFDLVEIETLGEESVITLPGKMKGRQAVVMVLSPARTHSEETEA